MFATLALSFPFDLSLKAISPWYLEILFPFLLLYLFFLSNSFCIFILFIVGSLVIWICLAQSKQYFLSEQINQTPFPITNFKNGGWLMEDMGGEWVVMEKASGSDRDSPCRCTAKEAMHFRACSSLQFHKAWYPLLQNEKVRWRHTDRWWLIALLFISVVM